MLFFERGDKTDTIDAEGLRDALRQTLEALGPRKKVLAIPPDITRFYSQAGQLTELAWALRSPTSCPPWARTPP